MSADDFLRDVYNSYRKVCKQCSLDSMFSGLMNLKAYDDSGTQICTSLSHSCYNYLPETQYYFNERFDKEKTKLIEILYKSGNIITDNMSSPDIDKYLTSKSCNIDLKLGLGSVKSINQYVNEYKTSTCKYCASSRLNVKLLDALELKCETKICHQCREPFPNILPNSLPQNMRCDVYTYMNHLVYISDDILYETPINYIIDKYNEYMNECKICALAMLSLSVFNVNVTEVDIKCCCGRIFEEGLFTYSTYVNVGSTFDQIVKFILSTYTP